MNAPLIFSDIDVPQPITQAAMLVHNWMTEQGHRDWVLMGIASRSFCDRMICEIENLKAERDTVQKELDQINVQLLAVLKDVRAAAGAAEQMRDEARQFQEEVFKLTTPATVEHVKNFKR